MKDKKTINNMICEALETESRKRKANNQEELESLGYVIMKYDGAWHIKYNNNTISRKYDEFKITNNWDYKCIRFGSMWNHNYTKRVYKPISNIDFVGLLAKEHIIHNPYHEEHTTYNTMQNAIWNRNYYKKVIDNAADEYQDKINRLKEEYEHKLELEEHNYLYRMNNANKQYTNAIKTINELLKK